MIHLFSSVKSAKIKQIGEQAKFLLPTVTMERKPPTKNFSTFLYFSVWLTKQDLQET